MRFIVPKIKNKDKKICFRHKHLGGKFVLSYPEENILKQIVDLWLVFGELCYKHFIGRSEICNQNNHLDRQSQTVL